MKRPDPHRWLVSYADFMTLLCVFFIMLYAIELLDDEEGDAVRTRLQTLFTSLDDAFVPDPPVPVLPLAEGSGLLPLITDLRQVAQIIPETDDITVDGSADWISVSLNADLLFATGETEVRDAALPLLQRIAAELRQYPFPLNIQGHADDTPSRGLTNWELSSLRAASVVQNLALYGVAPQRMAAVGLSYYHPLSTEETPEARRKNRRVVIYMTQNTDESLWTRPSAEN